MHILLPSVQVSKSELPNILLLEETSSTTKSSVQKTDFRILKTIGKGSYGKVYLVQHIFTEQILAMKVVKKELLIKTDQVAGIKVEREILEKFDHPFIMGLQFAF